MSRRKQTKPRQIKRSLGDLEEGDDRPPDDLSLSEDEGGASDQEDSAECDSSPSREPALNCEAPAGPGTPDTAGTPAAPGREEEEESPPLSCKEEEEEAESYWDGPDELHLSDVGGVRRVLARRDLAPDATWGPYSGRSLSAPQREGQEEEVAGLTLTGTDTELWLKRLPVTSNHSEANCTIYSQGEELYCKVTKAVQAGDSLLAGLPEPTPTETHNAPVKEEEPEPPHPEIHLLPQQAGMAAILATAIINKDVFPCKACGIWYRSERNLQAHLQFYCASRKQSPPSPASPASPASPPSPPPEHPEERVRPPPRCAKSCPSASASTLETPARTRSGERPFLCLICLSAFSSKPSCERHLQMHTDARGGACPACGFAPATPDLLHGHLLTRHTAYRPGARSEGASPGPGLPPLLLSAGLGEDCGVVLKCQVCGFPADTLALLQQHVQTHLKVMSPAPRQSPSSSASPDSAPLGADVSPAPPSVRVKEEPQSDAENEAPPPSRSPSPRAPPTAQVKAEPASATPGSSPEPQGGAAPPPQASEILAKMTEMVHARLRQSHTPTAPVGPAPARPVHKGATCFECDITFNNVNNFYVHKRLYCSGRHQHGDTPAATPTATPTASQPKERAEPSPPALGLGPSPGAPAPRAASDGKPAEAKAEGAGLREASGSEGESGGRASEASEGSQSPGGSGEDAGDPDATFCRACNIRFSRRENYAVHKRFYCAWRRPAPGNQRPPAGNGGFPPQPVRTRKRKKMYEIHAARGRALAGSAPAPEPALALVPPPGLGSTPSPRPEGDGPVDLRKRPRPQEPVGPPAPPAPVLSDYHKCTACSISFNSIENYLAHKAYYCPVPLQRPPLQPRTLAPPRPGPSDRPDPPPARTRSPGHSPPTPGSKGSSPHSSPPSCPPLTCPYCPPGGTVAGDLVDHFRTAHGLVLTRLPCGPPPGSHSPGRSEAPPPQASPALKPRLDAANGSSAPSSPLLNGSPRLAPPTPPPAVSPVAEVTKEAGRNPPQNTPALAHVPAHTSPKAAQVSPLPNGTSRFCRLCNIRFSSLSTFVAHKKYYCSSHSAEHVK